MRLAARSHRNQQRKASDIPYIAHPASVALILLRAGFHEDHVLAAALLHDVVEDTALTLEELRREFPPQVVSLVAALTERKRDQSGSERSWHDRKREHREQITAAPLPARAIFLADKLHNLATMLYDLRCGSELWSRFNAPREDVLAAARLAVECAAGDEPRLRELAEAARCLIAELEQWPVQ